MEIQSASALTVQIEQKLQQVKQSAEKCIKFEKDLAVLLEKHGFKSISDYNLAVEKIKQDLSPSGGVPAAQKRKAKITPELEESIIADLKAGSSATDIAAKYDISVATVNNRKKAAGLTKSRPPKK